jgi:hypothetical protein
VQLSATSHPPATAARQTTVEGWNVSAGQVAVMPLHTSTTSQAPAAERHTVPDGPMTSAGQLLLEPLQLSATSHALTAGRQTARLFSRPAAAPDPVQLSGRSPDRASRDSD